MVPHRPDGVECSTVDAVEDVLVKIAALERFLDTLHKLRCEGVAVPAKGREDAEFELACLRLSIAPPPEPKRDPKPARLPPLRKPLPLSQSTLVTDPLARTERIHCPQCGRIIYVAFIDEGSFACHHCLWGSTAEAA